MFRWWVSADVTVGVTVSNQWDDRIVGDSMDQLVASKMPTNSNIGVWFSGTTFVTNGLGGTGFDVGAIGGPTGDTLFFIFEPDTVTGTFRSIASDKTLANRGPIMVNADLRYIGLAAGAYTVATLATSNHYDIVAAWFKQDATHFQLRWYSNSVPIMTNTTSSINDMPFNVMGGNVTAGDFGLHGYLLELGIYTNNTLNQTAIDALHLYATNKYGYSP